ncbi:methylmalonyl Co-A mutase-associated GTPase MeaB [Luteipulveratus flavus]|uniref:Methylmalonyl Co-A mutase-associated GTPase MeaB n=1 Tax=Luteipulveratus flavus TaxID=3031728 RepID=A0ABT6C3E2_9MICO|nr:methylmalonyl Co-A mutase-associated GTPase MeaB [Luteipulveratus sp. YIM 133296]MDF8263377.1 methylmalonyl Co-A mutase-associated GTPase MeaB [Luteipulveratus sp. YIM 133296]
MTAGRVDVARLAAGVRAGDRSLLSRAITLLESTRADHRSAARELLTDLAADDPGAASVRLGVSGVPGVGKSTFIEALGSMLIERGYRVGVLAVDPSSTRTGGSVLGDKTRMPRLAANEAAYVRPSPTAGTLGGVTRATAQTIPVLEAAGYDVVLVETVGVGQSETAVAQMVDTFLLLGLARSGDQLQGIKKGILEIADVLAVNKADGAYAEQAATAAKELAGAIRLVHPRGSRWVPPVLTTSGLTGEGIDRLWDAVVRHRESYDDGGLAAKRSDQQWALARLLVQDELEQRLRRSRGVREVSADLRAEVLAGRLPAVSAADRMLAAYDAERLS